MLSIKIKILLNIFFILFLSACSSVDNTNQENSSAMISQSACDQVIEKEFSTGLLLSICYDYTYRSATVVSYTLEGLNVNQENITKRPSFFIEKDLPKDYQVSSDDYIRSGYDRGHLAPDASFDYNNEDLKIIYTMANIIPQDPNVNREFWSKAEKYEREMAVSLGEVKVINLVLFDSKPLYIKDKIAISKGFIKGIFNSNQGFERCFYYDNFVLFSADKDTLDQHEIACNTVF